MKKVLILFFLCQTILLCRVYGEGGFVPSDLLSQLKDGEKAALLMVHFGTTYDDTRVLTIDAINQKAQKEFPEMTFKEAYTSRIVIRRLKERGIHKILRWRHCCSYVPKDSPMSLYKAVILSMELKWNHYAVTWKV